MLGSPVHATFGISFPIRFDYLDTFGGGNPSVHGYPRQAYMRSVFGWPYTQHESHYLPPEAVAEDAAGESFHVLNVVEGTGVLVEPTDPPTWSSTHCW